MQRLKRLFRWIPKRATLKGAYLLVVWCCACYLLLNSWGENTLVYTKDNSVALQSLRYKETTKAAKLNILDLQPLVDKSPKLSEENLTSQIQATLLNLPITFWLKHKGEKLSKNKTCAKFPSPYDINFNNVYWQTLKTSNGTFHLYAAYYDNRTLIAKTPVIRLLGMIDRIQPKVQTYCQLWLNNSKEPLFSKVWEYKYVWNKKWGNHKNGFLQPYLMSCFVPPGYQHLVPVSVSLVENPCDMAKTSLRVINNRPSSGKKEDFAVCVKGLDFLREDLSVRMVEWLELLFLLGAHKVFLYDLEVHPNITKVLNYYTAKGLIEVTKLTLPGEQPNILNLRHMYLKSKVTNKRQNEVIPYNDCFYKNMYRYNYIILLDTDEVIIPKSSTSWKTLMDKVTKQAKQKEESGYDSYNVRNVYFMDSMLPPNGWNRSIPRYMHMLQHTYRSFNHTKPGSFIKCFHDTERVKTLHNHFPFSCLGKGCSSFSINTTDAQLQHYRVDCVKDLKKVCKEKYKTNITLDTAVLKYQEPLVARVTDTLAQLGFFGAGTAPKSNYLYNLPNKL